MVTRIIACAVVVLGALSWCGAQEPVKEPAVATVLGEQITARDLWPPKQILEAEIKRGKVKSAEEWVRVHGAGVLRGEAQHALGKRYIKEHHLEATEAEIASFTRFMSGDAKKQTKEWRTSKVKDLRAKLKDAKLEDGERKKLEADLAKTESQLKDGDWPRKEDRERMREEAKKLREELKSPELAPADRKRIERELATNERFQDLSDAEATKEWAKFEKELTREMGVGMVEGWKLHRALFKEHGGRIMFQQAGLEPIDAVRTWLEEREKAGDFVIHDAALKEEFWKYWRSVQFVNDKPTGREFDKPFWEMPRDGW